MDVEAHRTKLNVANLKACNQLVDLDKVTFSKKDPNLVCAQLCVVMCGYNIR
jgi:hypothetical protein